MKLQTILFTVFVVAAISTSCNNSSNTKNANAKPLVVATADALDKYQCPMKCQSDTAYTAAGQCPVCEMDLEKVE